MTLIGTLTVVWYSVLPWLWLLAILAVILLVPQIVARMQGYGFKKTGGMGSRFLPPLFFLLALFFVPWHTDSSITYVNTWVDWLNLIGAAIAIGIYSWLVFHPICYLRNRPR